MDDSNVAGEKPEDVNNEEEEEQIAVDDGPELPVEGEPKSIAEEDSQEVTEQDGDTEQNGVTEPSLSVQEPSLDEAIEDIGLPTEFEGEGAETEADFNLGTKPFGDYPYPYTFDEEIEGEGVPVKYPEEEELPGEGCEINYNASFSDLDALIKMLEGDKCEDSGESNKATLGSAEKNASEGQAPSSTNADQTQIEEDNLIVLGPDHPKMERFQKALKAHLERQLYNADCEIRNMENESRMKKKEREDLGNQLYNLQYELQRQTDLLEKYDKDLEGLKERRSEVERDTEVVVQDCELAKKKLDEEVENEKRVMKSIKEIDMMEWCVRQAAQEFDGELKIRQLVDEKFEKLRYKTELEKRDQDFYLDKILTHVQRMEQANEGIQRQIQAHNEEQKELSTYIAEAETEIEAIHIEKTHLQRAWNETVTVVRSRDEALNAARETLKDTIEQLRNRESEMRSLQRAITKEQESHERATVLLKRRRVEERYLDNQVQAILKKNDDLRNQLAVLLSVRKQVEEELMKSNRILTMKEKELSGPRRKLEQLNNEKARLEDAIMEALKEQASLGKIAQHISHKVDLAKTKARKLESESAKVENDMTRITVQVERLRGELLNKEMLLQELEKKLTEQEKVLADQAAEIKDVERMIQRKTAEVLRLNKKLQKLVDEQGGKETTPLEKELEELERKIQDETDACTELQQQWLRQQEDLVTLTAKRDDVLKENDLIRKEAFVMERKKQRLTKELEQKQDDVKKVQKEMVVIRQQISYANAKLYDDKMQHTQMDRENALMQNEFIYLLKDAEMNAIELQEQINHLQDEKEHLQMKLQEAHEQSLNWDKKIKYAKELKDSIKKEQESSGSVLKLAIHHMKVRYQELCRAQEKLMQDLERSIEKRDRIIQEADNALKRAHIQPKKTKLNIQRNYNKLKERNRVLVKEAVDSERQVKDLEEKIKALEKEYECESEALEKIKEMVKAADERINEAAIQKHKNLIEIILRQQKYKVLESVKHERYRPLAKSKDVLENEIKKIEAKCFKLVELSDMLIHEFPDLELQIKLIKASIIPSVK
ncbi:unnamed protein product [Allacma fusca]|uniref:Coiled-coil domain-containing protein 40 n=1 Tax=Allacma fusca TaxID=39272 RepID=A0A8J2Q6A8_9HEXA|nr:unnamed protein product [Allacma fusca]